MRFLLCAFLFAIAIVQHISAEIDKPVIDETETCANCPLWKIISPVCAKLSDAETEETFINAKALKCQNLCGKEIENVYQGTCEADKDHPFLGKYYIAEDKRTEVLKIWQ